ncbi:MarR family transcriptional regulator [Bradyrhizobium diazoefficiens]|nr:MarR family transcriptional regulator [Bradyrhizobium sp. LCT2]
MGCDVYRRQLDCAQLKLRRLTFNCSQLNVRRRGPTMRTNLVRFSMARKLSAADAPLRLDNQICFAVYSAAHAFNRVYKPLLDRLGLTYPQYLVMLVLWERDDVPVKDIGERLFLDSGTLTPLLKRLEAAHLVKRTRSSEDERQVLIALTPQGHALKDKARAVPQSILAASDCSVSELVAMKDEIVALRDRLNAVIGE